MKTFYPNADGTLGPADWRDIRNYQGYKIPILYLSGSIAGMTKDNKVTLDYIFGDRAGSCTLKWQGSGSITLPTRKKNYTITFDTAFEAVSGWGSQKKYCLKANWVDPSHARNVVSAKLWGKMVKSRATTNDKLNALPNGGAIDGFPIIVSINGKFHGLYTFNIPKEGWMLGMDETGQQAIVCAEWNNNGATAFKGLATFTKDSDGYTDFELEYSSDDQSAWVLTSLNRLLGAVKDSDGTNIQYGITPYLDWDSAIDYYILSVLIAHYDGMHRNYLLHTFDGVKFGFTAYDKDVVYGNRAQGAYFYSADTSAPTFAGFAYNHKLFELIWTYMRPQLRERFNELVSGVMSAANVANEFTNFALDIPMPVYCDDERLWQKIPSAAVNNIWQIISWYQMRLELAKEWIKDTAGEKDLPTQIDPDAPIVYTVSNSLTGCTTSNSAITATENTAYNATISASEGYTLDGATVVIKMGGVDVTETAYSNGVIAIGAVTGNVSISVTAVEEIVIRYTNQVPLSIDTDGSVYNGVGYANDTRLSSSGVTKAANGMATTGFIKASAGDVIRIKHPFCNWYDESMSNNYICAYKSDFSLIGASTTQNGGYTYGTQVYADMGLEGDVSKVTLAELTDIAYIRVCQYAYEYDGSSVCDGSKLIVTVNEEIT